MVEVVTGYDEKRLRVGVHRGLVQFWILKEEEDKNGWLILIPPDELLAGIEDRRYEGENWTGGDRSMTVKRAGGTTKVRVHHPAGRSGMSIDVDTEALAAAVAHTLNRIIPQNA